MATAPTLAPAALRDAFPEPPPGVVPRARLVRSLVACRNTPVAVIAAPPGYGKSTLLAEWAARDERPFRWSAMDGDDEAVKVVERTRAPQVIVVDDVHLAVPAAVRRLVQAACELPPGAMLALASRRSLAMPTGRLRAHRLIVEITRSDLAMSRMEAAMLLGAAGLRLEAREVDLLIERTEGWPAALYLAALSLGEQADDAGAVTAFTGADRLIAEYLDAELLSSLTEDQRAFLRRTSVLTQLTGPLCDAVLGADESSAMLDELGHAGIPFAPLDRCNIAFRHHALLAAALRAELRRLEPELEPVLHGRAAQWHARNGEPEPALRHAIACREVERAGALLWSLTPGYVATGRASTIGTWLGSFAPRDLAAHPTLCLAAAGYHLAEGRRDHAARALAMVPDGCEEAMVALLRAGIGRQGVRELGQDAARACALAPPDAPWQSMGLMLAGVSHHLTGDRETARHLLEDGAGRAADRIPPVAALCHAQLALLAVEASEWVEAERCAHAAHAALEQAVAPSAIRALVLAVYAVVAAQRGDVAQARHDAADARLLLASLVDFPPWVLAEAHVWLARAEIRLSDGPSARALLARAARLQAQVDDATVLAEWVHEGWERADAFAESATGAGPTLTNAELRVLRLLPSHLSFREIGERLHVSTNTVKTQALSVYRKLDVSSRSEAVSRGRSAGLVDG